MNITIISEAKKNKVIYYIYSILIITSIIQDFILKKQLKQIGQSLTALITPIIFLVYLIYKREINIDKYTKILLMLLIYLHIINIVALIIHIIFQNGNIILLGENIIIKYIKGSVYLTIIIMYLILLENFQHKLDLKEIFKPYVYTFFLLFFILILEIYFKPIFNYVFHGGADYNRIRLTTSESSFTGTLIIAFFIPTLYYFRQINKNIYLQIISCVIFMYFVITSGSKGFILAAIISIMYILISDKRIAKKIKYFMIGGVIILVIAFLPFLINSFKSDLAHYTSTITRLYTAYCGIVYSLRYPFGTGNSLYLFLYPKVLYNNMTIFNHFQYSFNLTEIYNYIYASSDYGLSVKNSFLQYGLYWGALGTICFIFYWFSIYKRIAKSTIKEKYIILFGYIFIVISLLTYMPFDIKYEVWSFIPLATYLTKSE